MHTRLAAVVAVLALAAPATAGAGGFATVGLAPPPASVGPGDTWNARFTVLQHGRTPIEALEPRPVLTVDRPGGGDARSFTATPVGDGVYVARVTFPAAGRWAYTVDAFGVEHAFAPVGIAERGPVASGGGGPGLLTALGAGLLAGLAAALATAALQRWRPQRTAPAAR